MQSPEKKTGGTTELLSDDLNAWPERLLHVTLSWFYLSNAGCLRGRIDFRVNWLRCPAKRSEPSAGFLASKWRTNADVKCWPEFSRIQTVIGSWFCSSKDNPNIQHRADRFQVELCQCHSERRPIQPGAAPSHWQNNHRAVQPGQRCYFG